MENWMEDWPEDWREGSLERPLTDARVQEAVEQVGEKLFAVEGDPSEPQILRIGEAG